MLQSGDQRSRSGSATPARGVAAAQPAAPLQRPTLRVQGQDIILEDAASPSTAEPSMSTPAAAPLQGASWRGSGPQLIPSPNTPAFDPDETRLPSQLLGSMNVHVGSRADREGQAKSATKEIGKANGIGSFRCGSGRHQTARAAHHNPAVRQ